MRSTILLFFLCLFLGVQAQTQKKQTTNRPAVTRQDFLGIQMGGNISTFKSSLVRKGYKYDYLGEWPTTYRFTGSFNNKDCVILVEVTPKTRLVYRVTVSFTNYNLSRTYLDKIYAEFDRMAEVMTNKYGKPDEDARNQSYNKHCLWYKKNTKNYMSLNLGTATSLQIDYVDAKTEQKAYNEGDADL